MSDPLDFDDQDMEVDASEEIDDDEDDDSGDSDIDAEIQLYEKYAEILKQISAQSNAYDNYVQLVQVAQ